MRRFWKFGTEHQPYLRPEALRGIAEWIGQARSAGAVSRGEPAGTPQGTRKAEPPGIATRPPGAGLFAAIGVLVALGAGCLESNRGTLEADTTTEDVADTRAPDAADPCDGRVCDDGDPCTVGACDPGTGACVYSAIAGAPECSRDGDCDDGDPCTAGVCVSGGDACGWAYCEFKAVPGACGGCHIAGCPEAGPCLAGVCQVDGTCRYDPIPGCHTGCGSVGAVSVRDAIWDATPGTRVKVSGVVAPHAWTICDDGPDCWCEGAPAAQDEDGGPQLLLEPPTPAPTTWGCAWSYCHSDGPACNPLHVGTAYWFWGEAEASGRSFALPREGPALPPADTLLLEDYCLQTNAAGLVGAYQARLAPDHRDVPLFLEGRIDAAQDGTLTLTLAQAPCANCPEWLPEGLGHTIPVELGDGHITFELPAPSTCGPEPSTAVARLFSKRNSLEGRYEDAGPSFHAEPSEPDESPCASGDLVLVRLP